MTLYSYKDILLLIINMLLKSLIIFVIFSNFCYAFTKPSILNLKCNDYLDSLNINNKIVNNFKDILKLQNGKEFMSYSDLIHQNHYNNLKYIYIRNNEDILSVILNDNTIYKYCHSKKIDLFRLLNILHNYYI